MKLITAIVQPQRLGDVINAVTSSGAHGMTTSEVHGFGQQYGRQSAAAQAAWDPQGQAMLLPKVRVDVVVPDDRAEAVAEAIAKYARTGAIGDGKIWIAPVEGTLRVRTGERDDEAL